MDRAFAKAAIRIGKELAETKLIGYNEHYALGLGVALAIVWEAANNRPIGSAHNMHVNQILEWVRDLQKYQESQNARLT